MHNLAIDCTNDCNEICGGTAFIDACGECVPFGDVSCPEGCDGITGSGLELDECGVCDGDGAVYGNNGDCCENNVDDCGVCGGDNSECSGCQDTNATNYDEENPPEFPCDNMEGYSEFGCCEYDSGVEIWNEHIFDELYPHGVNTIVLNDLDEDGWYVVGDTREDYIYLKTTISSQSIVGAWITFDGEVYEAVITTEDNGQLIWWTFDSPTKIFNAMESFEVENGDIVDGSTYEHTYTFTLKTSDDITFDIDRVMPNTFYNCPLMGDLDGGDDWNVLDIVILANCIVEEGVGNNANGCPELEFGCAGDLNLDGGWNVLDIVVLANCILDENCGE